MHRQGEVCILTPGDAFTNASSPLVMQSLMHPDPEDALCIGFLTRDKL